MSNNEVVHIDSAIIQKMDHSIVQLRYRPDYEIELSDVKEVEKVFVDLFDSEPIHCLMDMTGRYNHITKEAQKHLSKGRGDCKDRSAEIFCSRH